MPLADLHCACANLRRAARLVTQLYSREMGSAIEPSQFALLATLNASPGLSQNSLGAALGLDKTTLSRNLRLMARYGWLEPVSSADRRARGFALTREGRRMLSATKPGWERAQAKLRAALGPGEWSRMSAAVALAAEGALAALGPPPD
jgi:DNA-binding MarR family transcriptional regulator